MLKSIYLKNFKSFNDTTVSFTSFNDKIKPMIIIYGENGSGKTNLIDSIDFLKKSISTLYNQYFSLVLQNSTHDDPYIDKLKLFSLMSEIKRCKMINSIEDMILEYIININGKDMVYHLEFNNEQIIKESLCYPLEKNIVELYSISFDNKKINKNLFDNNYQKELEDKIDRFFGKHTFLAIVYNEIKNNNKRYMDEKVNKSLIDIIEEIQNIYVYINSSFKENEYTNISNKILSKLDNGIIKKENIFLINNTKEILNLFFTTLYSDIKSVDYDIVEKNDLIKYSLYFNKMIHNEIRSIPYTIESTGTLKLLNIFPYIYEYIQGHTICIDEIDNGIHDLLIKVLVDSLLEETSGQLIMTTHNTYMLKSMKPEYVYIINSDNKGDKTVNCVKDFERIQNNHNLSLRYLNGAFGGIPLAGYMDLYDIINCIDNESSKK